MDLAVARMDLAGARMDLAGACRLPGECWRVPSDAQHGTACMNSDCVGRDGDVTRLSRAGWNCRWTISSPTATAASGPRWFFSARIMRTCAMDSHARASTVKMVLRERNELLLSFR